MFVASGLAPIATMPRTYHYRLLILLLALALAALAAVGTVQTLWAKIHSLERRLTAGQLESFRLAADFQERLQGLNHLVLRFLAGHDPAAPAQFRQAGEALNRWIDRHDPQLTKDSNLTGAAEREILPRLNAAFDDYLAAAADVFAASQPPVATARARAPLDRFEEQAQRLFALGEQLADAHRQQQEAFLAGANQELSGLRFGLFLAICAMLALVVVLGAVLYRDQVRPLRVRLVQSEALLERQEKLATLGTLAAGIAHEIRNPLTSIKARLYTLGKHIKGNQPGLADAQTISAEIARLERIVQDVLSFARPSDPRSVTEPAEAPLREVQSLMAETLASRGVRLVLEPAGSRPLFAAMDAALIKQVVINLVRNAAEAIEGAGTVTLRTRAGRATVGGAERAVAILEVSDTGAGIAPEVEARLFDPFFTTKESGTGLGLSIAARIVEKHGGMLQYQTRPGRGTTFGIVLPAVAPPLGGAG